MYPRRPGEAPGKKSYFHWVSEENQAADPTVGVYVHVPFCERVCPYCDFAVVAARPLSAEGEAGYVSALLRELASRRDAYAGSRLASIYLGGGTPSLLTPNSIGRLIDETRGAFESSDALEITLEVNPSTLERSRLVAFREAGVNRVSVGVQSFDDRILQRLGRAHRVEEAHRTLAACREAEFSAVSLDLIIAAPDQALGILEADLDAALRFGPDHISIYELSIESRTPFALAARRGQLSLPNENTAVAMLEIVEKRLCAAGFDRYEISNYARAGFEAIHNHRYWDRRPVLGLGVGAFSTAPPSPEAPFGARRSNVRDLSTYLSRIDGRRPATDGPDEIFDAATARGEAVFLALRDTRGLRAESFADEFGASPRKFFGPAIDQLVGAGLLDESANGNLRLSTRGRLLADTVSAEFVSPSPD
jgi:oxygen-independent coproporphyrinogen-3 oxidase